MAVKAARAAFNNPAWRDLSSTARGDLMFKLSALAEQHSHLLATVETWDNGKAFSSAQGDVDEVVGTLKYYAGFADKIHGQTIETSPAKFAYTLREPVGVCGQIIPWNYPLAMAAWKLGPALACGNTVVLKAAESTPLSILVFANLIKEAGFPPGVINIINGHGREAGAALIQHPDVDKVAFTGSTATGREIMKMASQTLKTITLETGGKSPLLVFADADLDNAVYWAHKGIMANQGQICTATSRILVHDSLFDAFLDRFVAYIPTVSRLGDPFVPGTTQGPQVSQAQYDRVLAYVQIGKQEGARLVCGGEPFMSSGYFIQPTVFTEVTEEMRIYREEVFGPFVVLVRFTSDEEALRLANGTEYGLGAALFTSHLSKAHRMARAIQSGMVWINSSNDSDYRVPFGGVKQSGIGRELGEAGLAAYSNIKAVHVNLRV
ncbi:hypothetical protein ASPZODRAFT_137313 [Penicilliopsis zonata CBS 506.65]|uniref:Aldehyde dehydrogenase domain-containing protein n=1 Tax=Penicilliopsis zonata CBS 506.65 TaxID=1073090 RepID=A0A1L9S5I4_9EURO|nr:hypothetical protein ASPZODRAFT_137313 [Penicilliopsis zonata CBS 506.65]OJJ42397.1 hypothetical protein ASPZODRAFT_137313 [Penicilliopsis zonata CBS 506.65]